MKDITMSARGFGRTARVVEAAIAAAMAGQHVHFCSAAQWGELELWFAGPVESGDAEIERSPRHRRTEGVPFSLTFKSGGSILIDVWFRATPPSLNGHGRRVFGDSLFFDRYRKILDQKRAVLDEQERLFFEADNWWLTEPDPEVQSERPKKWTDRQFTVMER